MYLESGKVLMSTSDSLAHNMIQNIADVVSRVTTGDLLVFVAGVLLVLYIVGTRHYDFFHKRNIASTKPLFPFIGDFLAVFLGRLSFSDTVKKLYEKGKGHRVFGVFEFSKPQFLIRDPELLKIITIKDFDNFINHRTIGSVKTDPVIARNLSNLRDQEWRDVRATMSPAFTSSKIKAMLPLISQCAQQLTHHLHQKYASSKEGKNKFPLEVDMKNIFTRVSNDVIATTAFGLSCNSLKKPENEFYTMGIRLTTFDKLRSLILFASLAFPKLIEVLGLRILDQKARNFFVSLVHETKNERKKNGIYRPDVLQMLMQAQEGNLKSDVEDSTEITNADSQKMKLTDDDLSAQAIVFFLAGFENIATALCLVTNVLAHHPEEQKKLQEEISHVMEETKGKPTYESIQGMKYLDAVINETLRLYPLAPATDRVCRNDTTIPAGEKSTAFAIKEGNVILIPIIGLHHDPQYWEEPEKFEPERFSDENKHKIKPFTYLPFGAGPRVCIGQRFAMIEVKAALVHLLAHFDLHPNAKTKHPLEYLPSFIVRARDGFWCGLTPRVK